MPLNVGCPGCQKQLRLPEALVGQLCGCPRCGRTFTVQDQAGRVSVQPVSADGMPEPVPASLPARGGPEIPTVAPAVLPPPLPASPGTGPRPFVFRVRVFYDPARRLAGELQARVSAAGLELRDRRDELYSVPIGGKARYLGGPRLAIGLDGREVTLLLTQGRCQQAALARDLVLFLAGKKPPLRLDDYRPSRLVRLAALAPLLIPLVLITARVGAEVGAVLWCGAGLVLVVLSWLLLRNEARSHRWRLAWTATLWGVSVLLLAPVAAAVDVAVRAQRPSFFWYTYVSPDGKWNVPVPAKSMPFRQQRVLPGNPLGPGPVEVTSAEITAPHGRGLLRVQVWARDVAGEPALLNPPEPTFRAVRDSFLALTPGMQEVASAPVTLHGQHPGMYYHYQGNGLRLRMSVYCVGTVYYVLACYCREPFGEQDADRFLHGFAVTAAAGEQPLPEGAAPEDRGPPPWRPTAPRLRLNLPPATDLGGLVVYYKFDEGRGKIITDASGHAHVATLHGGWWVDGIDGKALMFDGERDYLDLGSGPHLNWKPNSGFTVSLWVATVNRDGVILSQRGNRQLEPTIDLMLEGGLLKVVVRSDDAVQGEQAVSAGWPGFINDGVWHHVLFSRYPNGSVELYVDGELVGSAPVRNAPNARGWITTSWRTLGCERSWVQREGKAGQAYFQGCVDEFCVFDRTLMPAEVRRLAGRG